ncbi:MAG: H-type small acid-soluble spore protein [Syntrophomonadaceae bacterium]|nr:H-type small acid-soluble spore protein [Syntrophomonadaceae bacterium]
MLVDRAREIMESKGVIEVFYQGHPVWIEQIEQDTARIRMLDNNQQLNVPIKMLAESE